MKKGNDFHLLICIILIGLNFVWATSAAYAAALTMTNGATLSPMDDGAGNKPAAFSNRSNGELPTVFNMTNAWSAFFRGSFDKITIHDGTSTSAPVLYGPASGTLPITTFRSTTGPLTVQSTTDNSGTRSGRSATLDCMSCSGAPANTNVTMLSPAACTGYPFTLGLSTTYDGPYAYQWQSATTSGGPYTNIAGATNATFSATPPTTTTTIYYKCAVTCSASRQTTLSNAIAVTPSGSTISLNCPPDITTCTNPVYYPTPDYTATNTACLPTTISGYTFVGAFEGRHYFRSNGTATWANAKAAAIALGGHLPSINSAAENDFLAAAALVSNTSYWIGLTDEVAEGTFLWANGEAVSYTNWNSGEPNNNGNEDFIEISTGGGWNDLNGTSSRYYFVELAAPSNLPQTIPTSLVAGPTSGSDFLPGTTTVTYGFGEATCSFTVTMNEPPATTLVCPPNITTCANPVFYSLPAGTTDCTNCTLPTSINGMTYVGQYNGHTYFRSNSSATWANAKAAALANDGYLAVINDAGENAFLQTAADDANASHWIGLTDEVSEGTFLWVNGEAVSYTNWNSGEPNNNGDHAEMSTSGGWNDLNGTTSRRYFIEFDCSKQNITPHLTAGGASGSNFAIGTTTVTYNYGGTTCSFNVTLNNPTPTAVHCPANITVCSNTVDYPIPSVDLSCTNCMLPTELVGFNFIGTFGGHNYFGSIDPDHWDDAEEIAIGLGGHLASISNSSENNFLHNYITTVSNNKHWIGLTDGASEGTYAWTNGEAVNYLNWSSGEPNNFSGENSIEMYLDGTWNDLDGSTETRHYIIEFDCRQTSLMNLTAGPASGSNFPVGTTTVTHTYGGSTCSFTVTRNNPTTTLTCPPNITTCLSQIFYPAPVGTATCGDCNLPTSLPDFTFIGTFNNHNYFRSNYKAIWSKAYLAAAAVGGALVSINSAEENAFVYSAIAPTAQDHLIGLTDRAMEGTFVWANGDPLTYTNWASGEPNNVNNEDFVEMYAAGVLARKWNDNAGSAFRNFIVEFDNCDLYLSPTLAAGPASGSTFPNGMTTVSYTFAGSACSFTVTVDNNVSAATATPSTINCGGVSQLNATSAGNQINWYTQATGGSPLGSTNSGQNFAVSPAISTTYYAEAEGSTNVGAEPSLDTFVYTGNLQTWTAPAWVNTITVDAWGAGGGSNLQLGGAGGRVKTTIPVTPGTTYNIVVGGRGVNSTGRTGAGGGGFSGILLSDGSHLVTAGGGGGANGNEDCASNGNGGAGGGASGGQSGENGSCGTGGAGGSSIQSPAGGAGGTAEAAGSAGSATGGGAGGNTNGNDIGSGGGGGGYGVGAGPAPVVYFGLGGGGGGGFGGGGGGGSNGYGSNEQRKSNGGGGGGGYRGGAGGNNGTNCGSCGAGGGGGGASFVAAGASNTTHTQGGGSGAGTDGVVYIQYDPQPQPCYSATRTPVTVTVNAATANAGPDQTGTTTCGLTQVALAANNPSPGTGAWSIVSGAGGSFGNASSPSSTFTGVAGNAYTLRWTVTNASCGASTDDVNVTFNQTTTPTCPANRSAHVSDPAFALTGGSPSNGTYSGPGVNNGMFNPATAGGGTHTITYSFTNAAGCTATCTFSITVNTTACPSGSTVCISDVPFALTGGTPSGGTYSGPGVSNGNFNPATAGAGTHTITYTNGGTCTFNITVKGLPSAANAGPDQTGTGTCNQTLVTLAGNTPTVGTGTWSIISGTGGSLSSPGSPTSTFSGNAGATYTLRWTVTNAPCAASTDEMTVTFNQNPTTAAAGFDQPVCGTSATLAGNSPGIGTGAWTQISGPGTANFGAASSPTSGVTVSATGVYTLRWTTSNAPCAASTDDVVITFNPSTTSAAEAGPDQTGAATCGQTQVTLAAVPPVVGTGAWSIQSGTGGNIANPNSPTSTFSGNAGATYTLRWTVSNPPCSPNTDEMVVTFNQNPTPANAGPDQTGNATCGQTQVTLAANAPTVGTGTWSIQSGTGGSIANPNSPASMFSGTAGNTYTLRWTVTNAPCAASTDEMSVTFNQNPTFSTCPPGVTVNAGSGCSATATYTATAATTVPVATVTYVLGGATTGSGSGTGSGSNFNIGTTTVSLTATNSCGTSSCSFSVVVRAGEANVQGNGTNILDGDAVPDAADHTDFGQTMGANVQRTFTVQNIGTANLNVTGIALGGTNADQFSVGALSPPSPIAPNGSATFVVTYAPTTAAVHNATVIITNGDCDEAAYDFAIKGELTCTAPTFTACPTATVELNTPANGCAATATYNVAANGLPAPSLTYTLTGATTGNGNGTGTGLSFNKGTTTVAVTATNPCGTPTCTFSVRVTDNVPPTIVCPAPMTVPNTSGQCGAYVTYAPTVSDNCSGVTFAVLGGPASGSLFPIGTTTVQLQASDAVGLTATCSFTVRVNDTEQPNITCPNNIIRSSDANACGAAVIYTNPTYSDNCPGAGLDHLGGGTSGSTFPVGTTNVTWMATDASNNTRTCSFTVTVNDVQAPTIACPANLIRPTTTGQCAAQVTFNNPTATDNCAAPTLQWVSGGTGTVQGPTTSTGTFGKGTTTVQWKATDAAGLTKTCTFRVIVNDTEAPTMSCPAGLNVNASPGQCVAAVTYSTPTYTDNCAPTSGTAVRVSGPASGSMFPVGTTNVVFRATDAASNTRQCTLTVTVVDNQPPTITCPPSQTVTGNGTPCAATVFYNAPTASDNCAGTLNPFLVSGLASGSIYPVGTTVNTWRALDPNGVTAQCAFSVTVNCPTAQPTEGAEDRVGATSGLWLAPNPAATEVVISIQGDKAASGTLSVYDAAGRLVWQQTSAAATVRLDVSAWPGGVYAVSWRQGAMMKTKRLVVARG